MVTQNESQNLAKISSKSTIVHQTMNVCRNFVFRKILNMWNCEGKHFPPCFFNRRRGFHKNRNFL